MPQTSAGGAPVLVLLPGMHGNARPFAALIAALGPDQRILAVEYPPDVPMDYYELDFHTRAALPDDGAPFVLLGESFSGPVAVRIAASQPPGLRGLILSSSFLRNPHPWAASFGFLLRLLPAGRPPHWVLAHLMLGRFMTPALYATLKDALRDVTPEVLRARLEAVRDVDVMHDYVSLEIPLLYLHAARDRVVPPMAAQFVKVAQPDTRIAIIEAPHMLLQAAPEEAAKAIAAFLRDVQGMGAVQTASSASSSPLASSA
jgi:pimeloyl-ACP methyl ester carboxylesterase